MILQKKCFKKNLWKDFKNDIMTAAYYLKYYISCLDIFWCFIIIKKYCKILKYDVT